MQTASILTVHEFALEMLYANLFLREADPFTELKLVADDFVRLLASQQNDDEIEASLRVEAAAHAQIFFAKIEQRMILIQKSRVANPQQ